MASASARARDRARMVRVGILAIVGLVVLAVAVYEVGKVFDIFASRYRLTTVVSSAAGLREGAPVTLAGQRVGQVSAIDFLPLEEQTEERHVAVGVAIDEGVRRQIRRDSRAFIRSQGLLGDKYIDISPGTPNTPILREGDTLTAAAVVDLENVLQTASSALDSARLVVGDLHRVTAAIAGGRGTVGRLLQDDGLYLQMTSATSELADVLRQIQDPHGTLGRLVHDPALYDHAAAAIARVDTLTAVALNGDGTLGKLLHDPALYDRAVGTVGALDSALVSFNRVLGAVEGGDGTMARLMNDPALYEQLLKAVVDLQTLIEDVRKEPGKYKPKISVF